MIVRRAAASVVALAMLTAGCSTSKGGDAGSSVTTTVATATVTPRVSAPPSSVGGATASSSSPEATSSTAHPVFESNFPDPGVLHEAGTYFVYGTNDPAGNVPMMTSRDLTQWTPVGDAMPTVASWASTGNTWAPEVMRVGGQYRLYYTARVTSSGLQCVGVAVSSRPAGPFADTSAKPLVCQNDLGGSIDADPFLSADGTPYLAWKNDGNCCAKPVHLWSQRLSADGTRLVGPRKALLTNTKVWQGKLVEAPEMVVSGGAYYLFYSANTYDSDRYAIGWARCKGPLGPCADQSDVPLVASNDLAAGPGHCFLIRAPDGSWRMLFHAWSPDAIGSTFPGRQLWLAPLRFIDGVPKVDR